MYKWQNTQQSRLPSVSLQHKKWINKQTITFANIMKGNANDKTSQSYELNKDS